MVLAAVQMKHHFVRENLPVRVLRSVPNDAGSGEAHIGNDTFDGGPGASSNVCTLTGGVLRVPSPSLV